LKHEISRLRPVFDGAKYVGVLLHTAQGWTAYDQHDRPVGTNVYFGQPDAAVARLRRLAASERSS
jgi:hypothetical protein